MKNHKTTKVEDSPSAHCITAGGHDYFQISYQFFGGSMSLGGLGGQLGMSPAPVKLACRKCGKAINV